MRTRPPYVAAPEALIGLPKVGEIFDGKYRIDGVLGVGGMGVVLGATHLRLDEPVAIKLLLPQWSEDTDVVQRFLREGRASAKIRSEHVVRVLDVAVAGDRPYLVLEYLEGKDFDAIVEECGPLEITKAVDCLLQACEALAEAHLGGVIHRDLKPANLFLTHRADGSPCVKVLDFGISKVASSVSRTSGFQKQGTLANTVMGSPHYMSPEQMQSSTTANERSDIWSIGAILHELLAGKPPFEADTVTELCARVLRDPPAPLSKLRADVPPALQGAVLRCLEKDPARRFPNVAELARALAPFGTASAHASAETISRIVEGGIGNDSGRSRPGDLSWPRMPGMRRVTPRASDLVSNLRTPLRSKLPGYAFAAAVLLLIGGGVAWKVVHQVRDVHAAEARTLPAEPAPVSQIPLPPPATASAPATPAPAPVSRLTTTGAIAPAAATTGAIAPRAAPAPHVSHPHHARKPPTTAPVSATPDDDNPFAQPSSPPAASPAAPAPPPAPAVDPSQLFEGRK